MSLHCHVEVGLAPFRHLGGVDSGLLALATAKANCANYLHFTLEGLRQKEPRWTEVAFSQEMGPRSLTHTTLDHFGRDRLALLRASADRVLAASPRSDLRTWAESAGIADMVANSRPMVDATTVFAPSPPRTPRRNLRTNPRFRLVVLQKETP